MDSTFSTGFLLETVKAAGEQVKHVGGKMPQRTQSEKRCISVAMHFLLLECRGLSESSYLLL